MRSLAAVLLLLGAALALPAATSAASCELVTGVSPGNVITINGIGFPAASVVDITQTWSGGTSTAGGSGPQTTSSTATTDAAGEFTFEIDAGPGRGGTYDIEATAGGCTAKAHVAAIETAGGTNPGGSGQGPLPATDTAPIGVRAVAAVATGDLAVLAGIGLLGLAALLRRQPRPLPRP